MAIYHAFAGDNYYPCYGLGDYVGGFTDLDEAISVAAQKTHDWLIVLAQDSDTDQLVEVYNGFSGRMNTGANLS